MPLVPAEMAGPVKKRRGATTVCVLTDLQESTAKWVSIIILVPRVLRCWRELCTAILRFSQFDDHN